MTSPAVLELPTPEDVLATPAAAKALAAVLVRARDELLAGQALTAPTSPGVRHGLVAALRRARWRVLDAAASRWVVEPLPARPAGSQGPSPGAPLVPLRLDMAREANVSTAYRRVLYTSPELQVTAMALGPGAAVGEEAHPNAEQLFMVTSGRGEVRLDGRSWAIQGGELVLVPAGMRHDVVAAAAGPEGLRLLAVYSPPLHIDGRVHETRADAEADAEDRAFGDDQQRKAAQCLQAQENPGEHAECVPARYRFAVEVPGGAEGGARCSTCRFAGADAEGAATCYNTLYVARMGTGRLPVPAERWCCSLWTVTGGDGAVGDDSRATHGAGI
jgi:mannose-6-phosphate isomerase-like protein (cupin superfamily)